MLCLSKVHFYAESDGDFLPVGNGMYSTIARKEDNRFMSLRHDDEMKDGVRLTLNYKSREWAGATENYTLSEDNDTT